MGETRHPSVLMSLVDRGRENMELDPRGTAQGDAKRRDLRALGSEEEKEKQQARSLAIEEDLPY